MAITRNLQGTGVSPLAAAAMVGTLADGLTATGSNQASALLISNDTSVFSTVPSNSGCRLPIGGENDQYLIVNDGANALLVYPPVGGTINGGAVNAPYSIAVSTNASLYYQDYVTVRVREGGGVTSTALAAPTGAALVGSQQTGTATVPRTLQAEVHDAVKVQQYGGVGNGTADDTAAFARLEVDHAGQVIDLYGLTYSVTAAPQKNFYVNGVFKVSGNTRQAAQFKTPNTAPMRFHVFGGQLQNLHASLCNPLEQMTNITFVGDSITWGENLPENATTSPRTHQLSDPRDNFASGSFVNEFKRWVGSAYFDNATPTLSNWIDSSSGQSTANYTRTERLYTNLSPFSAATLVNSASSSDTSTLGTLLGYRHRLGVADATSTAEISFTFTGSSLTLVFTSNVGAADYVLTVDSVVIGTYQTDLGNSSYQNRRVHSFTYVRNKVVKIKAVYPAAGSGVCYADLEALEVTKTCAIVNQGIIGTDAREYYNTNFGAHGHTIMTSDVNYVFLQLGTNDRSNTFPNYNQPNGVNNFGRNLTNLIGAMSNASIILMTANPAASDDPATYSFGMQDVRNTILGVAASSGLDVVDNYAVFQNLSTEAYLADGLHPNLLGHAVIAQNIANAVGSAAKSGSSFGALTATTVNGNTITTGTGTLTLDAGKTFRSKNTITLQGTDSTTITLPSTSATMARTDAAQTFTGTQTFSGLVGLGAASTGTVLSVNENVTGATTAFGVRSRGTVQSDVTAAYYSFGTFESTQAAAFTLPLHIHFGALQGTIGAGSTITDQRGFYADGGLTGATSNYGFYGNINAASGRWNLYMAGSAQNYMLGVTGIGIAASSSTQLALPAGTTSVSPLRITHGVAPTSPVDGDMWSTTAGLFIRINGVTKTVTLT